MSMKDYAFFRISNETDAKLLPVKAEDNGIWDKADEARRMLALLVALRHGEHRVYWYYERTVCCDIEGGCHAVCCLANSGENHDRGTFNPLMDDGEEYLYFAEDGTPMLMNSSDEFGSTFYRVHEFGY